MFHGKRHPNELGQDEVQRFLVHLADLDQVSTNAVIQARSAIAFLYREVFNGAFPWLLEVDVPKRRGTEASRQAKSSKVTPAERSQGKPSRTGKWQRMGF